MSTRDAILTAVRANRPDGAFSLPELPDFPPAEGGDRVAIFRKNLEAMGGRHHPGDAAAAIEELFPAAKVIVSTTPAFAGTRAIAADTDPRTLADVDVAIVRAAFGVAETGSVLLLDEALTCNAVAYLAQHLIVLLDPAGIVPTLQDAYRRREFHRYRYASFHTGPSATADIEGVLIHGAQGVRSLTVLFE